jgi:cytochrome P450 / NADPH-cytochrome P450 reductase
MTTPTAYEPIPQPPGYPILGNLFDIRGAETPIQALMKLARQYGPICAFSRLEGRPKMYVQNSLALHHQQDGTRPREGLCCPVPG